MRFATAPTLTKCDCIMMYRNFPPSIEGGNKKGVVTEKQMIIGQVLCKPDIKIKKYILSPP
jgi:hypothetical protein